VFSLRSKFLAETFGKTDSPVTKQFPPKTH
jgi:hypothetical protein